MAAATRNQLLKHATSLVKTHGFSREALSQSVLHLPPAQAHQQPLSESAVSALFGEGDAARTSLIRAWLDEGVSEMKAVPSPTISSLLQSRLRRNEDVLQHLPEAFALLATPSSPLPPIDFRPAVKHSMSVADEACHLVGDGSVRSEWFARRGSLAAIYTAAELHQITSPHTAYPFLKSLLETSSNVKGTLDGTTQFLDYVGRSWLAIFRSRGLIL